MPTPASSARFACHPITLRHVRVWQSHKKINGKARASPLTSRLRPDRGDTVQARICFNPETNPPDIKFRGHPLKCCWV
ncbi:hypothetical protein PoB_003480400 [Plakobranchus ocellatus]|uniref:Uncharacterized protein n=1 Tax=Plakobranchus ocellatus TaxID=259542 RepID=A0AAV4AKP1_9GAST|nr:hypothetical protein PoB_003480400 [Plakobranchus ocellatus]